MNIHPYRATNPILDIQNLTLTFQKDSHIRRKSLYGHWPIWEPWASIF